MSSCRTAAGGEGAQPPEAPHSRRSIDQPGPAIETLCFCDEETTKPVWIEVRGGQTVSMTNVDDDQPVGAERERALEQLRSIDKLFAMIEWTGAPVPGKRSAADKLEVRFDATLGYPTEISIDWQAAAVDEEMGYRVTAFSSLEK